MSTAPSAFTLYKADGGDADNAVTRTIAENRNQLLKWIHYPDTAKSIKQLPPLEQLFVAVAEHQDSIVTSHPSFKATKWFPSASWSPKSGCPQRGKDKLADSIENGCDHGTLIIGLLEDGADELHLHGLAPGVQVDVVDPQFVNNLFDQIDKLISQDSVVIVNFSQLYEDPNEWNTKQERMRMDSEDWKKHVLLVVASGGQQDLLAYESVPPPLRYLDLPDHHGHIIGVGAASSDGKAAYATADGSSDPICGYGKKFVQIIAPGIDVVSTVYDSWYGKASGSSFAAPQVTATALLLRAADLTTPAKIKARLIYTSDWLSSDPFPTTQPIWGGYLNVTRAALMPWANILVFPGNTEALHIVNIPGPDSRIELIDAKAESYDDFPPDPPSSVDFSHILRISRCGHTNKYRVVYMTGKKVAIAIAELKGQIIYSDEQVMDPWGHSLEVDLAKPLQHIDINQVYDFTASSTRLGDELSF
jgi:Subtilase family